MSARRGTLRLARLIKCSRSLSEAVRAWLSSASRRSRSSVRTRSVMSRSTTTTPITLPLASLIGAPLPVTGKRLPLLASRSAPSTASITAPLRSTWVARPGICSPVEASIIGSRLSSAWPTELWASRPVSCSATAFIKLMQPSASVATTASPMLRRVVVSRCSLWRRAFSASRRCPSALAASASAWCRRSASRTLLLSVSGERLPLVR